jgi:hypothetical protein
MGADRLAKQLLFGQLSCAAPAPEERGARRSSFLDSYVTDTSPLQIPSTALRPFALGLLGAAAERPAWFRVRLAGCTSRCTFFGGLSWFSHHCMVHAKYRLRVGISPSADSASRCKDSTRPD